MMLKYGFVLERVVKKRLLKSGEAGKVEEFGKLGEVGRIWEKLGSSERLLLKSFYVPAAYIDPTKILS